MVHLVAPSFWSLEDPVIDWYIWLKVRDSQGTAQTFFSAGNTEDISSTPY
jgi:hypothetical protein